MTLYSFSEWSVVNVFAYPGRISTLARVEMDQDWETQLGDRARKKVPFAKAPYVYCLRIHPPWAHTAPLLPPDNPPSETRPAARHYPQCQVSGTCPLALGDSLISVFCPHSIYPGMSVHFIPKHQMAYSWPVCPKFACPVILHSHAGLLRFLFLFLSQGRVCSCSAQRARGLAHSRATAVIC